MLQYWIYLNNSVLITLANYLNLFSDQRQAKLEIRVGFDGTDFSNNDLCALKVDPLNETEVLHCPNVPSGRYISIQRMLAAPVGSHGDVNLAPLSLCEVEIIGSKGKLDHY